MKARRWRWLVVLVACVALGFAAAWAWRWYALPGRMQAALPEVPALDGWPASLGESLNAAEARASTRGNALEGVADLGRLYHANGFFAEAEACWRLLRAVEPHEAQWAHLLADVRRAASDYDEMEALLREVVHLDPGYAPAWLQLGNLAFKTGRFEEAEAAFTRRVALVPGDPYGRLGLARLALQTERHAEARHMIDVIVQDQPEFAPAQNLLAEILAAAGDDVGAAKHRQLGSTALRFFEADDPWLDALITSCLDPKRLRVLATIDYQIERGDRGVALMERAARLIPNDPDGYAALGDLHTKLGNTTEAREALQECLRLSTPRRSPALIVFVNLSHALRMLKQPAEGLQVVQRSLEQHPDAFELYNELGLVLGDLGRLEEAVVAFRRAIAGNPSDPQVSFNLAVGLLGLDRRSEAYAALEGVLAVQPAFPQALSMLGRLELEDGRMADAEKHLRLLYAAHPDVPEARWMLGDWELRTGLAAEKRGEHAIAERHYLAGATIDPENAKLLVSLGVSRLMQGRVYLAVPAFEAYRRLEPTDPQGALFLGQAYARLGRVVEARSVLNEGVELADRAGNVSTAEFCREILSQLR